VGAAAVLTFPYLAIPDSLRDEIRAREFKNKPPALEQRYDAFRSDILTFEKTEPPKQKQAEPAAKKPCQSDATDTAEEILGL
jgi:hypothetical protein